MEKLSPDLILIPVSLGELADKITILEIKKEKISDQAKLTNIVRELDLLSDVLHKQPVGDDVFHRLLRELGEVNRRLWDIEDRIRDCEREGRFDLKTGRGGLLDIEFATQWLQMRFGFDRRVRTTDTLQALEALFASGYLFPAHYETLRAGYLFLRRLEQRIHILRGAGTSVIDERSSGLSLLARRMGLHAQGSLRPPAHLMRRYREVTGAVRAAYLDVLRLDGEEPSSSS